MSWTSRLTPCHGILNTLPPLVKGPLVLVVALAGQELFGFLRGRIQSSLNFHLAGNLCLENPAGHDLTHIQEFGQSRERLVDLVNPGVKRVNVPVQNWTPGLI